MEAVATAPAPGPVHDLKTLVLSRHPAIVIETAEPERAQRMLATVAADLRLTRFEWSVASGLVRADGQASYQTEDPVKALAAIAGLQVEGLFELHDLSPYLDRPELSAAFRRLLERLAQPGRLSTLVLIEGAAKLPPEIEAQVVRYDLSFPSREEYRQVIAAVVESLTVGRRATVEIGPSDYDDFSAAMSGLTLNQARQALARAAIDDGRLSREDLASVAEIKAKALQEDGLLEYFPPADNRYELGGFANLRRWLGRARMGFTPEAAQLGLQPPKGVLLVGVQGCGKSLAAKVIAREWGLPLLKLDAGRLYDKYIGETEKNFRRAIATAESCAPAVLWIDELEKAISPGGGGDSDGGLSRRLFGSFLTWLQEKTRARVPGGDRQRPVRAAARAAAQGALRRDLLRGPARPGRARADLRHPPAPPPPGPGRVRHAAPGPGQRRLQRRRARAGGHRRAARSAAAARPLSTEMLLQELASTVPLSVTRREDVERLRTDARGRFVPVR